MKSTVFVDDAPGPSGRLEMWELKSHDLLKVMAPRRSWPLLTETIIWTLQLQLALIYLKSSHGQTSNQFLILKKNLPQIMMFLCFLASLWRYCDELSFKHHQTSSTILLEALELKLRLASSWKLLKTHRQLQSGPQSWGQAEPGSSPSSGSDRTSTRRKPDGNSCL